MRTLPDKLPKHLHPPRREDYEDQEDYEEALAFFRHRVGPTDLPKHRSSGSRKE
jgi:hypothetical protein